jgi:dCTP deaminase
MSLLTDQEIRSRCVDTSEPLIIPFSEGVSGGGVVSYGLSSAGYDLRLAPEVLAFKNSHGEVLDPKRFADEDYCLRVFDNVHSNHKGHIILPAHSYVLGCSLEYVRMPRQLKGRVVGKSTWARAGVLINTTPIEPGWEGHITLEIGNVTPCPVRLYVGEGIAQLEFETFRGDVGTSYADKGGVYQGQLHVTPPRVKA